MWASFSRWSERETFVSCFLFCFVLNINVFIESLFFSFKNTIAIKSVVPVITVNVYRICELHHLPQLMWHYNRKGLLLWQRPSSPKKSLLHPHPLPGTPQMTLFKCSGQQQRGPRAPPSLSWVSQLTPPEARLPPTLRRVWTPSPLCAGPKASGSLSAIILHQLATGPQWRTWTGLSLAPQNQIALFPMACQALMAKWRAAKRTAPPVCLTSFLGLKIRQHKPPPQANYQVVKIKEVSIAFWVCTGYIFSSVMFFLLLLFVVMPAL